MEAQGFRGRIWALWNKEELTVKIIQPHEQFITVEIKRRRQAKWLFTVVYAYPHVQERENLWDELQQFATNCTKPWLIGGHFNETISLEERNHGSPDMIRRCTKFKHWIENNGLIDLSFMGPKFTWSRGRNWNTMKRARLDRALYTMEWRIRFQEGWFVTSCSPTRITFL